MGTDETNFLKLMGCITIIIVSAILSLMLGFKAIDYHFPSKFDKLVHCNKAN